MFILCKAYKTIDSPKFSLTARSVWIPNKSKYPILNAIRSLRSKKWINLHWHDSYSKKIVTSITKILTKLLESHLVLSDVKKSWNTFDMPLYVLRTIRVFTHVNKRMNRWNWIIPLSSKCIPYGVPSIKIFTKTMKHSAKS